ncbi:hypothetical protein [Alloactinosynnema sp. L-07]|uniref:hypothetical protein n=1 Tax=Alloactinosynnema sp. L-07 TaxID=1653480 RepID=UPI00065F0A70|nr:hypothetical protein [Alloactinosynnema sp. L-07]CRK59042.1 hypothetical protein [Alloactinosynnema sp. L-07]
MLTRATGTMPGNTKTFKIWLIENPATGHVDNFVIAIDDTIGLQRPIGAGHVTGRVLLELGTALVEAGQHVAELEQAAADRRERSYDLMVDAAERGGDHG